MAIWTHWAQIVGGIHLILASSSRKRAKMMDVDESSRLIAIHGIEADATDTTSGTVDLNTASTSSRIPLIRIDYSATYCSLYQYQMLGFAQLIWI
jgi:hypothetical protein